MISTPVFLPGESHGQRRMVGYSPLGHKELDTTLRLSTAHDHEGASQVALVVKNPPAKAGDVRDAGLIPGLGRFPGEGNGNPLQHSHLENSMDRGAWRATVHGVKNSQIQLRN